MDVTFIQKIRSDFPEFVFKPAERFSFRTPRTIFINLGADKSDLLTLHELGHALLGHTSFKTGVERVKMERAAWEEARKLAEVYEVEFDEDFVEAKLDTYRDWLDKKTRCPKCGLTRFQDPEGNFHCPRCENFS